MGPWLFEINGQKKYREDIHKAYSGYKLLLREQLQQRMGRIISETDFDRLLASPETIEDQNLRTIVDDMRESKFAAEYVDIQVVLMQAAEEGYDKDPEVNAKLEFIKQYYLANMFIFKTLKLEDIQITDSEIENEIAAAQKADTHLAGVEKPVLREMISSRIRLQKALDIQRSLLKNWRVERKYRPNDKIDVKMELEKKTP